MVIPVFGDGEVNFHEALNFMMVYCIEIVIIIVIIARGHFFQYILNDMDSMLNFFS